MAEATGPRLGYDKSKRMVVVAGLAVLAVVVAFEVYRGIDPVEVAATIMFVPVLLAFIWKGLVGGLVAGSLATIAYLVIRWPSIQAVPEPWFIRATVARSLAFLAFGAVGGWASHRLNSSLQKLELYDQIDDSTGLYNARYFVQELGVEMARVARYGSKLSLVVLELPAREGGGRGSSGALKDYAVALKRSLRPTDRASHSLVGSNHLFSVILPDTDSQGARVFADRLKASATEFLGKRGYEDQHLPRAVRVLSHPQDQAEIEKLSQDLQEVDRTEHPATASANPPSGT